MLTKANPMKITHRKRRDRGITLVELLPPIGLAGLLVYASLLLPALAKAKAKANRIKCVNNISQVGRSFREFTAVNIDRYPWLLTDAQQQATGFGKGAVYETSTLFANRSIKAELQTPKILLSPCDPERFAANDFVQATWINGNQKTVLNGGHSYGMAVGSPTGNGSDAARPGTVICMTRNISGPINKEDSLSDQADNPVASTAKKFAFWKGAEKHPADKRTMAGLLSSQGQLGTADGAAMQSNDAALKANIKQHHNELGGNYKGSPSGIIDTPND
jgi:hypothetical protein